MLAWTRGVPGGRCGMSQLDTVRIAVFYFRVPNWAPALPRYASVSSWETTSPLFSCWGQRSWKAQLSPARLSSASGCYTVPHFFTAFYLPLWGPLSWAFHYFCLHQFNKFVQFSLLSSLLPWAFLPGTGRKGEAAKTHGFLSVLWLWSIITGLFHRELRLSHPFPLVSLLLLFSPLLFLSPFPSVYGCNSVLCLKSSILWDLHDTLLHDTSFRT